MGAAALLAVVLATAVVPRAVAASEDGGSLVAVETPAPSAAPEDLPVAADTAEPAPEASPAPMREFSIDPALPEDMQRMPSAEPSEDPEELPQESTTPSTDDAQKSEQAPSPAPQEEPELVAPLMVPAPSSTTAVITVKVRGDHTSNGTAPLSGVTLRLYNGNSAPTTPLSDAWASCVSDSQGDCSFTVPDTQRNAENRDRRFWVVAETAPSGWYLNSPLVVGNGTATGYAPTRRTHRATPSWPPTVAGAPPGCGRRRASTRRSRSAARRG
jgi:hypothetical protein